MRVAAHNLLSLRWRLIVENRLAAISRVVLSVALLLAAGCMSGCGGYDVGPDPLPWSAPEETPGVKSGS
jgi:hypothetical protein